MTQIYKFMEHSKHLKAAYNVFYYDKDGF